MKHLNSAGRRLLAALLLLFPLWGHAAPLTPGNYVAVRVGDGTAALSSAATAVFLVEYSPTGTVVQTLALPTAAAGANRALTASGTATSELNLTRSADGQYLVLTGYDAAPGTAGVLGTASTATNRVVARIAADGTFDTSTTINDAFSATNIRSAATADGTAFYAVGAAGGVRYVPFGNTGATTALNTANPVNIRYAGVAGGNLYVTSGSSGSLGLSQVGTGLPTTAGQTATPVPGFAGATGLSSYAFFFADLSPAVAGPDVLYVADDRSSATDGGIQKYSLVGGTWTLNGTVGGAATAALRGLSGNVSGTTVSLVATGGGGLFALTDNAGYNAAPSTAALPTPLATAAANTAFRGVAFAPVAAASNPVPTVAGLSPSTAVAGAAALTLTVNGTGFLASSVVNFNGAALATTFVSATQLTAAVPASALATAGTYNVTVTNPAPGGGTSAAATFTVTAPAAPTIAVSPAGPLAFSTVQSTPSAAQTVTVSGQNLTAGVTATAPAGYELSLSPTTGFAATLALPAPGGALASTAVYVRLTGAAAGTFAGNLAFASAGATAQNVALNGTVASNQPTVASLSPSTAAAGAGPLTLTVNGTNFISGVSVVNFNGAALATTFVSATQLTAVVPASALATAGTYDVTVRNTAPGSGGLSAPVTFTVTAPPAPTIASFSPASGPVGTVVTITGTNLANATGITLNGLVLTGFMVMSPTQVMGTVPAGASSGLLVVSTPAGTATSATPFALTLAVRGGLLPGLALYPNPVQNRLVIEVPAGTKVGAVQLRDLRGRLVLRREAFGPQLDLGGLPAGTYLLELTTSTGETITRRVAKQ